MSLSLCNVHLVGMESDVGAWDAKVFVCLCVWVPGVLAAALYVRVCTYYSTHTPHTHTQVYSRLLESATSETSARMGAMENASKNCGEMIDKLTLDMNKARQAVITQELGEIVSGAAAVEDK